MTTANMTETLRVQRTDGTWQPLKVEPYLDDGVPHVRVPDWRGEWVIGENGMIANVAGNDWRIYTLNLMDCCRIITALLGPVQSYRVEYCSKPIGCCLTVEARNESAAKSIARMILANLESPDPVEGMGETFTKHQIKFYVNEIKSAELSISSVEPCEQPEDNLDPEEWEDPEPKRRPHEARGSDASNACFGQ